MPRYALFRRARTPQEVEDAQLLDDSHHAYVHELVLSARLDDIPVREWQPPLDVVALERAEADGYRP
jgi:hypothetical protein